MAFGHTFSERYGPFAHTYKVKVWAFGLYLALGRGIYHAPNVPWLTGTCFGLPCSLTVNRVRKMEGGGLATPPAGGLGCRPDPEGQGGPPGAQRVPGGRTITTGACFCIWPR